jgi:hypothetical protein
MSSFLLAWICLPKSDFFIIVQFEPNIYNISYILTS